MLGDRRPGTSAAFQSLGSCNSLFVAPLTGHGDDDALLVIGEAAAEEIWQSSSFKMYYQSQLGLSESAVHSVGQLP